MGMPVIDIEFHQKAVTAVKRSQEGIVGLILRDSHVEGYGYDLVKYSSITEINEDLFDAENIQLIKDAFYFTPKAVVVLTMETTATLADGLAALSQVRVNWVGFPNATTAEQTELVTWIKTERDTNKHTFKAVVWKEANVDHEGVVNFTNETVTFTDGRTGVEGKQYIASLLGLLAGMPMTRSATRFLLSNLKEVQGVANADTAIDNGEFILYQDVDKVRVGRGRNSLVTFTQDKTEDFGDIIIVEAMDMIRDDIYTTFLDYIGAYKNKYENQVLFFSAVNAYFRDLAREDILDSDYNNRATVDIERQKNAWLGVGKTEVQDYTDEQIKKLTFKKKVFMLGYIKILNAVEDIYFDINLF